MADQEEQFEGTELERRMSEVLTEGEMEKADPSEAARRKLPHPPEIRIQAKFDPVAEETKRFREIAEEVDGRYDKYVNRQPQGGGGEQSR
ncbi:hypothetical protein [Paenibacillus turpanensis]|uniref:hypothetical protein n=1 Tax=Paenibacillus turpanensis TaxID=2689078 RepID=UPI00140BBACC|nr:hypothetical protein [Paenibacillus turpanensis]